MAQVVEHRKSLFGSVGLKLSFDYNFNSHHNLLFDLDMFRMLWISISQPLKPVYKHLYHRVSTNFWKKPDLIFGGDADNM
jgi:hypothetical protein